MNKPQKLTPFKHFCLNIGVVPSAYIDAMTYYELLEWLCKYLQDTVIPTVNNNSEVVTELQNYVTDYFDNLDVQEEINNKLDAMALDGTLTTLIGAYVDPIYQAYETEINGEISDIQDDISDIQDDVLEFKSSINAQIDLIDTKVDNVINGSPIPVDSTDDMTDTSRVYVNTTDGKWYYYDGDSWEIGGTYQSTGIADGSISLIQLDNNLQSNFFDNYSEPIDLGNSTSGYCKYDGTIVTDSNFIYYTYSLQIGKTYIFTGRNVGNSAALVIKDNSNNVVYQSNPTHATGFIHYKFKCNDNNLTAYISLSTTSTSYIRYYLDGILREETGVYNNLKYTDDITLIKTIENKYCSATGAGNNEINTSNDTSCEINIYQASKGCTYKISGTNVSNICTCILASLDNQILYASSTSNIGGTAVSFTKEYTFLDDGYIIISSGYSAIATIEKVVNLDMNVTNKFNGKKIGCDGDSISHGQSSNISYVTQIATANGCTLQNLSVGGGTIATGTYNDSNPRHWICTSVLNLDSDCDIIMLSGGVNDYANNVPLGEITSNYTATLDSDTFYGGLETMCRNVLNRFKTQKIVFVTYHNITNIKTTNNSLSLTFSDYLEAIHKVMDKYGIPIIEVDKKSRFNTGIDYYKTNYTYSADGWHPTTQGYTLFYNDIVTDGLNSIM